MFSSVAQLVIIGISAGYVAIGFPVLVIWFYVVQRYYLATSRQIRLLDIELKAPLVSHTMETISGLSTILAFGWEERQSQLMKTQVDVSQRAFYLMYCIQRWLNLVLDLSIAVIAAGLVAIAVGLRDGRSASGTAVALVNIVSLSESIKSFMGNWSILETSIAAVARIRSLVNEVTSEDGDDDVLDPPPGWPGNGDIGFQHVSVSIGFVVRPSRAFPFLLTSTGVADEVMF